MNFKKIGLLAGLAACIETNEPDIPSPSPAPTPSSHNEARESASESFELGGITFNIGPESGLSQDKKEELTEKANAAYLKLYEYFGAELMSALYVTTVNVKNVESDEFKARVAPPTVEYKINVKNEQLIISIPDSEQQRLKGKKAYRLDVSIIEEENLAHEFIHLFLQGGEMTSLAFMEGLAEGLTYHLYPGHYEAHGAVVENLQEYQNACIRNAFDQKGWDTNLLEGGVFNGGNRGKWASRFLRMYWGLKWSDFFEKHPNFIKEFFKELRKKRTAGQVAFTKEEVIEIAIGVEPAFEEWLNNEGRSLQNLETQQVVFTTRIGEQLWMFNFDGKAGHFNQNKKYNWQGGLITTAGTLLYSNFQSGERGYITGNPSFGLMSMPTDPGPTTYQIELKVNEQTTTVPFVQDVNGKCARVNQ